MGSSNSGLFRTINFTARNLVISSTKAAHKKNCGDWKEKVSEKAGNLSPKPIKNHCSPTARGAKIMPIKNVLVTRYLGSGWISFLIKKPSQTRLGKSPKAVSKDASKTDILNYISFVGHCSTRRRFLFRRGSPDQISSVIKGIKGCSSFREVT